MLLFFSPVPSYNWTRKGAPLPKKAKLQNFNRVLIIPSVKMEDQGEYVCRATNDYSVKEGSIILSIQGMLCLFVTQCISFVIEFLLLVSISNDLWVYSAVTFILAVLRFQNFSLSIRKRYPLDYILFSEQMSKLQLQCTLHNVNSNGLRKTVWIIGSSDYRERNLIWSIEYSLKNLDWNFEFYSYLWNVRIKKSILHLFTHLGKVGKTIKDYSFLSFGLWGFTVCTSIQLLSFSNISKFNRVIINLCNYFLEMIFKQLIEEVSYKLVYFIISA